METYVLKYHDVIMFLFVNLDVESNLVPYVTTTLTPTVICHTVS